MVKRNVAVLTSGTSDRVTLARKPRMAKTTKPAKMDVAELNKAMRMASLRTLFRKSLKDDRASCVPIPKDRDSRIWDAALYHTLMSWGGGGIGRFCLIIPRLVYGAQSWVPFRKLLTQSLSQSGLRR